MNVATIRSELADALSALDLHCYATVPDTPSVPCAVIAPETISYADAEGVSPATFTVTVLAPSTAMAANQTQLDGWLSDSSTSVAGILYAADATSVACSIQAVRLRSFGSVQLADGGTRYLAATFEVDVIAP